MADDYLPVKNPTGTGDGRPGKLNDPETVKAVAECFVRGATREEMAEIFSIAKSTVTLWRRDPRVKAVAHKLIEDRVVRVTSRVDTEIEARLANPAEMTTKELLDVRKEYLGGTLRQQTEGQADADTINDTMNALESDPEFATELGELLDRPRS